MKKRLLNSTKIYYVSDGCGGQYKNFKNFLNLCSHKEDFSIKAEWIFIASSHRKSMCDGIGGGVKCHAAKQSLQRPLNNHTSCGAGSMPRRNEIIYLLGIDKEDMVKVREKMEKRFEDGKTVPGTKSSPHFMSQSASQIGHKLQLG